MPARAMTGERGAAMLDRWMSDTPLACDGAPPRPAQGHRLF